MKMQVVTIRPSKSGVYKGFKVKRELFDDYGLVDMAFCSVIITENGFVASGFPSIHKPTLEHDVTNKAESIDDFVKAVFLQ